MNRNTNSNFSKTPSSQKDLNFLTDVLEDGVDSSDLILEVQTGSDYEDSLTPSPSIEVDKVKTETDDDDYTPPVKKSSQQLVQSNKGSQETLGRFTSYGQSVKNDAEPVEQAVSSLAQSDIPNLKPFNRKNASFVWTKMTKINKQFARCNICGLQFRFNLGTTNMRRHVFKQHAGTSLQSFKTGQITQIHHTSEEESNSQECSSGKVDSKSCKSTSAHQTESFPRTVGGKRCQNTQNVSAHQTESFLPSISDTKALTSVLHNVIAKNIFIDPNRKKLLDQKVLAMIYKDMQPLQIVEKIGFKDLCYHMDPFYQLPSTGQLETMLITAYNQKKMDLISLLKNVDSVAITTDSWALDEKQSFLIVMAHYFELPPSWNLKSTVLACRPESKSSTSSAGLAKLIGQVLDEFEIKDKVKYATMDNTSSKVCLLRDHLNITHVRCFTDTLNLVVKDAIKDSPGFNELVDKVKEVVNYFHRNSFAATNLRRVQKEMGMMENPFLCEFTTATSWTSVLASLQQYICLRECVSKTLSSLGEHDLIISDKFVDEMESYCHSLEPFREAIDLISTNQRTHLSQVLMVVRQLQVFLKDEVTQTCLVNKLQDELTARFVGIERNVETSAATLLDPRFKRLPFVNEILRNQHENTIIKMMNSLENNPEYKSLGREPATKTSSASKIRFLQSFIIKVKEDTKPLPQDLSGAQEEFDRYMGMKYLDISEDPIVWWQKHAALFPLLSGVARKFLFIPATSVRFVDSFEQKSVDDIYRKNFGIYPPPLDMIIFMKNQ